ncbi:MAG: hypothetical protein V1792_05645 [Pseudomonadota bacterium]
MRSRVIMSVAVISALLLLCVPVWGNDPIKWSAPMSGYPNQWAPTPEPPRYDNPYGYRYPYYGYGYGAHDPYGYGSTGYAGTMQGGQYAPQRGFSGNPYGYYYGR